MSKGNPGAQFANPTAGHRAMMLDVAIRRLKSDLQRLNLAATQWDAVTKTRGDHTRAQLLAEIQRLEDERYRL